MTRRKFLIMDEEYWSIEPVIDRIFSVFGNDSIVYCADGSEGLEKLGEGEFSCIILDIMFPLGTRLDNDSDTSQSIKGGLIILKRIREVLKYNIPIICFTIRDDDEVKFEIAKYSNTYHISKLNGRAIDLLISQLKKLQN
jgi:CheY-like chemotaxis protein